MALIDTIYSTIKGTVIIDNRLEERSVASMSVPDPNYQYTFHRGQPLSMQIAGALAFAGIIDTPSKTAISPQGVIIHSFRCADWHYLADKRLAVATYVSQTCGYIVKDLVTNYLADEGVTIGAIQDGPVVPSASFNYAKVSDCLDSLKKIANFTWYIDAYKRIFFMARTTTIAPWAVTTADIAKGSAHWSGGNPQYRNTQYIRGGTGLTSLQTETRIGDGINLAFTMGYSLAQVPTITVDGVTMAVGIKGLDSGKDFYWSKGDPIVTASVAPDIGSIVIIAYYGQYPILIKSTDDSQIAAQQTIEGAGTGIVEEITDDNSVTDLASGFQSASAQLSEYGQDAEQLNFDTVRDGLAIGQMVTITHIPMGINNEQFLISAVKITAVGQMHTYSVTAIRGTLLGSWAKILGSMLQAATPQPLALGATGTVIISKTTSDTWPWTESATETIYACSVPATNLYPSNSLFPC